MTTPFWCLAIVCLLPYVWAPFGVAARIQQLGSVDNKNPRLQQAQLTGRGARALGAHQNAFEAIATFAPAVIVAHLAGRRSGVVRAARADVRRRAHRSTASATWRISISPARGLRRRARLRPRPVRPRRQRLSGATSQRPSGATRRRARRREPGPRAAAQRSRLAIPERRALGDAARHVEQPGLRRVAAARRSRPGPRGRRGRGGTRRPSRRASARWITSAYQPTKSTASAKSSRRAPRRPGRAQVVAPGAVGGLPVAVGRRRRRHRDDPEAAATTAAPRARKRDSWWITASSTPGRRPASARPRGAPRRATRLALGEEIAEVLDLRAAAPGARTTARRPRAARRSRAAWPRARARGPSSATAHPHPPVRSREGYPRARPPRTRGGDHPSEAAISASRAPTSAAEAGPRGRVLLQELEHAARRGRPAGPARGVRGSGGGRVPVVPGHVALAEGDACRSAARRA